VNLVLSRLEFEQKLFGLLREGKEQRQIRRQ